VKGLHPEAINEKSHSVRMYLDKKKDTSKEKDVYVGAFFQTCKVKEMEIDLGFDCDLCNEWRNMEL
jgi:hypothetical protein